jgi:hypothetical protein
VYSTEISYDFDEESTYSDPLSESKFIEEEPILEKFISTDTHLLLPKLCSHGNHSNLIEISITPSCDFIYEYYDELFDKHWTEKSFPRRERYSTHERELVNLPNP